MFFYQEYISDYKKLTGNWRIIACAGAGKTEFVSERLVMALKMGLADPDKVAAFTFTDRAARELKQRIRHKLTNISVNPHRIMSELFVGTLHSFAFNVLTNNNPKFYGFEVIDNQKRLSIFSAHRASMSQNDLLKVFKTHGRLPPPNSSPEKWIAETFFQILDAEAENLKLEIGIITDPIYQSIRDKYRKICFQNKFIDFSGLQAETLNWLNEKGEGAEFVLNRYEHFTVDEYQDISPIQEKIIERLSDNRNVCVVGDDDQSIYTWRGANLDGFLNFDKRFPNSEDFFLTTNFRSTDGIVRLSQKFISQNIRRQAKDIEVRGKPSEKGDLIRAQFDHQGDEIEFLMKRIKELVGKPYKMPSGDFRLLRYNDLAFVFRSLYFECDKYLKAFRENNIPVDFKGLGTLFATREVQALMAIFDFVSGHQLTDGVMLPTKSAITNFTKIHHQLIANIFHVELSGLISRLSELAQEVYLAGRLNIMAFYSDILQAVGLANSIYHSDTNSDLLYNLGKFSMVISDYEDGRLVLTFDDIMGFCRFCRVYAVGEYDEGASQSIKQQSDSIRFLTMHSTKGLSFPAVFIPNNQYWNTHPTDLLSESEMQKVEEERRLYYVAVTRATKYLTITFAERKGETGKAYAPKPYYTEIKPLIDEEILKSVEVVTPPENSVSPQTVFKNQLQWQSSFTELSLYFDCPYKYKLASDYQFQHSKISGLGFGEQIHLILKLLHQWSIFNKKVPNKELVAQLLAQNFYLRYAPEASMERLRKKAYDSLIHYVENNSSNFENVIATEFSFEILSGNCNLKGAIDLLIEKNNRLILMDYKTGGADPDLLNKYKLQVAFYAQAYFKITNRKPDEVVIHFLDSRSDMISINNNELDKLMENVELKLNETILGIEQKDFNRKPQNGMATCLQCEWNKFCPKQK